MKKVFEAEINNDWCKLCGICVGQCPTKSLIIRDNALIHTSSTCIGCKMCENLCPDFAIFIYPKEGDANE
jgi:2-oxoglutarate ferredoxin oxidoreductase subunit delta